MPANWPEVGKAITRRLDMLGMQQKVLADKSGVSTAVIREIQGGKARRRHPRVLQSLSKALNWPENHLEDVLRGHEAVQRPRAAVTATDEQARFLSKLLFILEHRIGEVVNVIYNSDSNINVTIEIRHATSEN